MSAHVGLRAEVVTIRGGGEKVVIRDVEGMVLEVVILGPETGPRGRDHKNVRLLFKAPFSRPKLVGLWGGRDETVVVIKPASSDEWHSAAKEPTPPNEPSTSRRTAYLPSARSGVDCDSSSARRAASADGREPNAIRGRSGCRSARHLP